MKAVRLAVVAAVLALAPVDPAAAQSVEISTQGVHFRNPALHLGQDLVLKQGDAAREVVVVAGDATIEGTVDSDVVVVLGKLQLSPTAIVNGSMIVVGGTATIQEGAQVHEDMVVIGGYEGPTAFAPGGHHVIIGTAALGTRLRGLVPWLTRGLLFMRPIVPDLWWVWVVAGVFFAINLLLNLLFDTPVRASAATLRATPLSAFVTGILVLLLFGPICVLLAISVIGIAVIPFALFGLVIGGVLGKIAFARWIGMSIVHQDDTTDRLASLRSFVIGSAVMCVAYMIPVVGLITWAMAGVFGLGAATLAFGTAYRREHPRKPKPPKVEPVPEPPPPVIIPPAAPQSSPAAMSAVDLPPENASYLGSLPAAEVAASGAVTIGGLLAMPRAAFLDRLGAFLLDFILVVIVAQTLDLDRGFDGPLGRLGLLVALAYHVGFWVWKGTTLGGIICNLRVVRTDGQPLQFPEALVRALSGIFSLAVMGLGFLWILRDPERQGWHDRVAGTYVVKVPRSYPI